MPLTKWGDQLLASFRQFHGLRGDNDGEDGDGGDDDNVSDGGEIGDGDEYDLLSRKKRASDLLGL